MTTTVLEAWEVLPDKQGPVERFTLPPSGSTLFVVYPDSNRRQPMHEELRLVDALRAQVADSTVVFLPPEWRFRVVRYGEKMPDNMDGGTNG